MSQSDYLRLKRVARELTLATMLNQTKTLNAGMYSEYKGYTVKNSVRGTTPRLQQLVPVDKYLVFDIEKVVDKYNTITCPEFVLCNETNTRANRTVSDLALFSLNGCVDLTYVANIVPCGPCCYDSVVVDGNVTKLNNVTRNSTTCANSRLITAQCNGSVTLC